MISRVQIAVLAAGSATRFGREKLLESWQGRPLICHALEAAQTAFPGSVMLVAGSAAEKISAAGEGLYNVMLLNREYERGIGTSIATAAQHCPEESTALVIALADQPLVTGNHLRALAEAWSGDVTQIVATRFGNVLGPPVLFGSAYLDRLANLDGDNGAQALLRENRQSVIDVEFASASIDIDTPEDLSALDRRVSTLQKNS